MPKLILTDITSGYASTTQLNNNFTAIETAIENTLSRDGTTPNTMSADLDMNGNAILNLADIEVNGVSLAQLATDADDAALSAASAYVSEVNAAASEAAAIAAADVVVDWDYVGTWTTATAYLKNNIVYNSTLGDSYVCLADHTSGTFATDAGNNLWGLLALHATAAGVGDMLKSENLSGLADYATARSNLGLAIGTNVQAYDAELAAIAGLTSAADKIPYFTGSGTASLLTTGTASGNVPLVGTASDTETVAGLSRRNTTAEAEAGSLDAGHMTPLKTAHAIATFGSPAGVVQAFAQNTAPTGWLKANGATISRTTYATLYSAIGTTFGVGDGSTTFTLPDLRGEFIRGWDDSRGIDSGRVFGSAQADAFKAHTHTALVMTGVTGGYGQEANFTIEGGNTGSTGGSETRPRNIALLYCIKY